jgi:hypothetical protein
VLKKYKLEGDFFLSLPQIPTTALNSGGAAPALLLSPDWMHGTQRDDTVMVVVVCN